MGKLKKFFEVEKETARAMKENYSGIFILFMWPKFNFPFHFRWWKKVK